MNPDTKPTLLDRRIVNGRYSGVTPSSGTSAALDRALRKTADKPCASYDLDARAIARVLVRHYGDEAEAVLERAAEFLDEARRTKR